MASICRKFFKYDYADIEEREDKAEEYKEKQEAAAQRNAALVNERKMRASEAAAYGKRAMNLGASEAQFAYIFWYDWY